MENNDLITISGPPGSGITTLTQNLSNKLNFDVVNGGDVFRQMAEEKDMTLQEFTRFAEKSEQADKELDKRIKQIITDHLNGQRDTKGNGLIIESRLAGWHADGKETLSVWLQAPIEVRVERISNRKETTKELRAREESEAKRYRNYYGIDITDLEIYDIILNTETFSPSEVTQCVMTAYSHSKK